MFSNISELLIFLFAFSVCAKRHRLARLLFLKMRLLPALRPFAPQHTSVCKSSQKNTNRAKSIILRCKAVFDERIFLKTKKIRIAHTCVFGCGFDAVFGKIIRQKQKYPCKTAPNATAPLHRALCCKLLFALFTDVYYT